MSLAFTFSTRCSLSAFQKLSTPWKSILRSVPVWALLMVQCAQSWGFWMLLTEIPSYMASIMRFDITKVSLSCNPVNKESRIEDFVFLTSSLSLYVFTRFRKLWNQYSNWAARVFWLRRLCPAFGILIIQCIRRQDHDGRMIDMPHET